MDEPSQVTSLDLSCKELDSLESQIPWLKHCTRLEELIISTNKLESLPTDLSVLSSLRKLDLSNNPITSLERILPGLQSLPKLEELKISLLESDSKSLLAALPSLLTLNGSVVACDDHSSWQRDLEKVALLYDEIREKWKEVDVSVDVSLADDFDTHVNNTLGDLSVNLSQDLPSHAIQLCMLKAKHSLFHLCQEKLCMLIAQQNCAVRGVLQETNSILCGLYEDTVALALRGLKTHQVQLETIQKENLRTLQCTETLLEASRTDTEKHQQDKEKTRVLFTHQKEVLQQKIDSLQQENKKHLQLIIQHSKVGGTPSHPRKSNSTLATTSQKSNSTPPSAFRAFSLKQLKDLIEDIYTSKAKYDQKSLENRLPRETMRQHIRTFFNQKYGLKSLITEWVFGVVEGVKEHSAQDNDIAVFWKTLQNQLDENFKLTQCSIKETAVELLRKLYIAKHPLKNNNDIKGAIKEKTRGFLYEEEWSSIASFMYDDSDYEIVVNKVLGVIQNEEYSEESL